MSPLEFAKATGISRTTVYRWLSKGRLKAVTRIGPWQIDIAESELETVKAPYKRRTRAKPTVPEKPKVTIEDRFRKVDEILSSFKLPVEEKPTNADQNTEKETADVSTEKGDGRVPTTTED